MSDPNPSSDIAAVPILKAGQWIGSRASRMGDAFNPSTGRVIARVPFCTSDEVDAIVRAAADALPAWAGSFDELLRAFLVDVGVDGIFTDQPDKGVAFLRSLRP